MRVDLDIFDTVMMSYARLSRRPLSFKSFTGLEITEFDIAWGREIFGGNGISIDYNIGRYFADAEVLLN
ncbi:MAG: hypothetical protein WA364_11320 [Candidatus Nitrosopolaris sp.]